MKWRWSQDELAALWYLSDSERSFLGRRAGLNRLSLAVMLKFFQVEGVFPSSQRSIPTDVLKYLAEQAGVDFREITLYDWNGRTAKRQRTEVLHFLGIQRLQAAQRKEFKNWLRGEVLPSSPSLAQMKELAGEWFQKHRLEPLSEISLERLLRSEAHRYDVVLADSIASALSEKTKAALELLLQTPDTDSDESLLGFSALKADPGRVSLKSVLEELGKLNRIRVLALPKSSGVTVSEKQFQKLAQRAVNTPVADFRKHTASRRYALLSVFCWQRQREIIDGLADLLIQVIHKIGTRAENKVEKELLDDFRRVRGKSKVLFQLAEVAIEEPEGVVE
jgi:Domain of unknown function (DUF4158)